MKGDRKNSMRVVLLGAGVSGQLMAEIASHVETLECVGYLDPDPKTWGSVLGGIPVLGDDSLLASIARTGVQGAIVTPGDLRLRAKLVREARECGLALPNLIAPSVIVAANVTLGEGIFISYQSVILTGVTIGDATFIGTGVNILHNTVIGSNCVIGGGTTIGARVTLGDSVYVGVGATVASDVSRVGHHATLAAGTAVLKDVPDHAVVVGNPGRVVKYSASPAAERRPPEMSIEEEIRAFLCELVGDGLQIEFEDSLIEQGILDSTSIFSLLQFVEERFQILIPNEDVTPENFDSVKQVSGYILRRIRP